STVLALRDDPFEASIFERMIFDLHRQSLVRGVEIGPLGNGPALQDTVELEAEVVMEGRRIVLLDDERSLALGLGRLAAAGLRRLTKIALVTILGQTHRKSAS